MLNIGKIGNNKCGNCHKSERDCEYEVVEQYIDENVRWIAVAQPCGKILNDNGNKDILSTYSEKKSWYCDGHKTNVCNKCNKKQFEHKNVIVKIKKK